jgi:serine/threonine-protein kinase
MAKVAGMDSETPSGLVKGTYGYVAPEQARGQKVTIRADVYVGCLILWELLTARKAIVRGTEADLEFLRAIAQPQFPSLASLRPDLPRSLLDVVERGLRPDPDRRALQADEVCSVLRSATDLDDGHGALVATLAALREPCSEEDLAVTTSRPPQVVAAALSAAATPLSFPPPKDAPAGLAHELSTVTSGAAWPEPGGRRVGHFSDRPVVLAEPAVTRHASRRHRVLAAVSFGAVASVAIALLFWPHAPADVATGRDAIVPVAASGSSAPAEPAVSAAPDEGAAGNAASSAPPAPAPNTPVEAAAAVSGPSPSEAGEETSGTITVPASRAGHRVWIDDRMVGEAPGKYAVRCGVHSVRVGSQGYLRHVRVPCETDVEVR